VVCTAAPSVVCAAAPSVADVYVAARAADAAAAVVDVDADGAAAATGESGEAAVCHGAAANPGAKAYPLLMAAWAIAKDRALCSTPQMRGHACR